MRMAERQGMNERVMRPGVCASLLVAASLLAAPALAADGVSVFLQHTQRDSIGFPISGYPVATTTPDLKIGDAFFVTDDGGFVTFWGQAGDRYAKVEASSRLDLPDRLLQQYAGGTWTGTGTATATGIADVTALFGATVGFLDPLSCAERRIFITSEEAPFEPASQFGFTLSGSANLFLTVTELETGTSWDLFDYLQVFRYVSFYFDEDGFLQNDGRDGATSTLLIGVRPNGGSFVTTSLLDRELSAASGTQSLSEMVALTVPFVAGWEYRISMTASCVAEAAGIINFMTDGNPVSAFCDMANSAYLAGFNNFRDSDGNGIAAFGLVAPDGTNLALASPSFPGGGDPIPEPATWAMFIAGFGLVGGAVRRRRPTGAARL